MASDGRDDVQLSLALIGDAKDPQDVSNIESFIRFLVANAAAGSVIGKGGSTINEFQVQSGAKIRVSRANSYFPGTSERIVSIVGSVSAILTALHLILTKISTIIDTDSGESNPRNQVKLILPNAACGAIIGKGGATIRSFIEDSGATIRVSTQDHSYGTSDRLITVIGDIEKQLRAVALILTKVSEERAYTAYASTPLYYSGNGLNTLQHYDSRPPFALHTVSPPLISPKVPQGLNISASSTSITVAVPDEHIGVIVGKSGKTIQEIQLLSGANIKLSDRGDYVEGTTHRKVTITGTMESVLAAQHFISQRVQQNVVIQGNGVNNTDATEKGLITNGKFRDRDHDNDEV